MLRLSVAVPEFANVSDVLLATNARAGMEADVDVEKLSSPPYCALNETSPLGNDVNEMFAVPPLSVPVPSSVCPA
jgi:hypothetical protein